VIVVALALLSVGGGGFLIRLMRGPTLADRIVALDGILTIVVTGCAAWGAYTRRGTYLTVGVVVALVAFLGTSAFARFIEERSR
jgi:multicomponent Na+:H+ antiporter subunit F